MASRDERIASLAATLRSSGVAKSDGQARMMAEEMIGVEEHVQKRFDEEHVKAQEFLKTAKNLGQQRVVPQPKQAAPQSNVSVQNQKGMLVAPLETRSSDTQKSQGTIEKAIIPQKPVDEQVHERQVKLEPVNTDKTFGNKSLKDLMFDQINDDGHKIENIEEMTPTEPISENVLPAEPSVSKDLDPNTIVDMPKPATEETVQVQEAEQVQDMTTQENTVVQEAVLQETVVPEQQPVLDSQKLVEMMEEDGKMEEHTREIKEKPKIIKPKEEYAENNVDLGAIFGMNKK